jgi:CBS domain-containing protein
MTRGVECARPEATLQEVATKMKELDVGAMPVCDSDRLVGIATDRDIVVRGVVGGLDPKRAKITEVMTPHVHFCFEDSDVDDCVQLMKEHQIRRALVLDRGKRLVGIVSLGDLAVDTRDDQQKGEALEAISKPAQPQR